MEYAIRAEGLRKRYGRHRALDGMDLEVPAGTVLGLLGPNGAGKTTTVRTLATLSRPDSGTATVAGFDVVGQPREVQRRIGLAGQYAAVDELLTGRENLVLLSRLLRLGRRRGARRAEDLLERFGLTAAADRRVGTYSGGMRRRLDLAACLVAEPPVVFLDEPTTGLDPVSRTMLWDAVREQVADGTTILLTTQYLEEADQLADSIVVVDGGRVIAEGTPDQLKRKIGEEWLEVVTARPGQVAGAVAALGPLATAVPVVAPDGRTVTAHLDPGLSSVAAAITALAAADVEAVELALRRPSLDDVFFGLTGHSTGRESA